MQNDITELRNQVRTLKRIVCLVCCLFGVFVFIGCSSRRENMNRARTYTSDNTDEKSLIGLGIALIAEQIIREGDKEEPDNDGGYNQPFEETIESPIDDDPFSDYDPFEGTIEPPVDVND